MQYVLWYIVCKFIIHRCCCCCCCDLFVLYLLCLLFTFYIFLFIYIYICIITTYFIGIGLEMDWNMHFIISTRTMTGSMYCSIKTWKRETSEYRALAMRMMRKGWWWDAKWQPWRQAFARMKRWQRKFKLTYYTRWHVCVSEKCFYVLL